MEELQEIALSKRCIIISPEELAKLTKKIRNTKSENSTGLVINEEETKKTRIIEQNESTSTNKINSVDNSHEKNPEVNCNEHKICNAVGVFKKISKTKYDKRESSNPSQHVNHKSNNIKHISEDSKTTNDHDINVSGIDEQVLNNMTEKREISRPRKTNLGDDTQLMDISIHENSKSEAQYQIDSNRETKLGNSEIYGTIVNSSDTNENIILKESLVGSGNKTFLDNKNHRKRGRLRKSSVAMMETISFLSDTNKDMRINNILIDIDNMQSVENESCKKLERASGSSLEMTVTIANSSDTKRNIITNKSLIDSDNMTPVQNKPYKKRGRPRKSSLEKYESIATSSKTNEDMIMNESLINRNSGRPRKSSLAMTETIDTNKDISANESLIDSDNMTSVEKKPCKNDSTSKEISLTMIESIATSSDANEGIIVNGSFIDGNEMTTIESKAFKKRGRPRKSSLEKSGTIVTPSDINEEMIKKESLLGSDGMSSVKNRALKKDDLDETTTMNESVVINDMNTVPRKRGRPKKSSYSNETTPSGTNSYSSTNENTIDESLLTTSKRGRKRKIVDYSFMDDLDLGEEDDKLSKIIKKEKIVKKCEVNVKDEASELSAGPVDTNERNTTAESLMVDESTTAIENTVSKNRRRPKKNLLLNETVTSPTLTKMNSHTIEIIDESLLSTSIKGRKRKKVNYSLLDDLELSEDPLKKEQILSEGDQDGSIIKDEKVNAEESDKTKQDLNDSTNYRWTGNATKAISQMLNIIHDKDIAEVSNDPLAGKIKRGRPKANADHFLDEDGTTVCMVCNQTIPNLEWLTHKKKVHYNLAWRKGAESLDLSNSILVSKTITLLKKEKGYLRCNRCKAKYKNSKTFINHIEECNGVVNSSGRVTCDVCKTEMEKGSWQYHNYREHNNLAWRVGDPPLNLEDQDLVLRILNALYKAKKPLHCEKCGLQKKSVMGYLSHKTTCQKSESELQDIKISCQICGKKTLPVSMDYHLKSHDKPKQPKQIQDESDYFAITGVLGKRRAAEQALQVINNIKGHCIEESKHFVTECDFQEDFVRDILNLKCQENPSLQCIFVECDFASENVDNLVDHLSSCEKKPSQYFLCKYCLSLCEEESDIQYHLKTEHNIVYEVDQYADIPLEDEDLNNSENDALVVEGEQEKKRLRLKERRKINSMSKLRVKPLFLMYPTKESPASLIYQQAHEWMTEFCRTNYGDLKLYRHLRNRRSWKVLDCDILSDYLPRNLQSCDVTAIITAKTDDPIPNLNFRKIDLFDDCSFHEGEVTIFCGGPITALAWLPTPYDQNNLKQVLAVATLNDPENHYRCNENYYEPSIVQFWDFGEINSHQTNIPKPSLLFGLAVTFGPIWYLEWCPSGCFDCPQEDSRSRLGLLAVAASDSFVYIYSIDNPPDDNDRGLIFKGEPILKLQMHCDITKLDGQLYYPTKISWSKAASHRYIAVGYSNGVVALYDLQIESSLLQKDDQNGTKIIFAYKSFQAHKSNIIALTLNHLGGGNKWLFTASHDRYAVFWDLTFPKKITCVKRNTMADGIWLTQWPTFIGAEDDSTYNDKVFAHCFHKSIRNLMSADGCTFTFAASGISALSYSDWLNTIFHGSSSGDVMAQFAHRMFFGLDVKLFRTNYTRCLFSVTKLIEKDNIPNNDSHLSITYNEASEKYYLAFLDYNLDHLSNIPNSSSKKDLTGNRLSKCDIREFCLQSVNKVVPNPNPQACSFYATGYQAGFVRLRNIQFLRTLLKN